MAEAFKSTRENSPHMHVASVRKSADRWRLLLADLGCLSLDKGVWVLKLPEKEGSS